MTRRQVQRREQRLREDAIRISQEVTHAMAEGVGMPWMSRESGTDMSYDYEHWRRWAALASEMKRSGAGTVAELGTPRVEHWQEALDVVALRKNAPLRAFTEPAPLVRLVQIPPRQPLDTPHDQLSD